jgi:hypothetical protein
MAKRPPSEAQDSASARTERRTKPRRPASVRDVQFGDTNTTTEPEQLTSESSDYQQPDDSIRPTDEDIRVRAYHRYLERGGGHGSDFDDWLEAERDLRQRR